MYLLGFPLLLITFAIYNIVAFLFQMSGTAWSAPLFTFQMVSGAGFSLSGGELLICIALLLFGGEVIKSTRVSSRSIVDHALSLILFLAILVEFLLVKQTATGTFFVLLMISFIDVIVGFAVTLRSAQRDLTVEAGLPHT